MILKEDYEILYEGLEMSDQTIRKYYSELGEKEWRRLVRDPYHRLEFDTTMHFFKKCPS